MQVGFVILVSLLVGGMCHVRTTLDLSAGQYHNYVTDNKGLGKKMEMWVKLDPRDDSDEQSVDRFDVCIAHGNEACQPSQHGNETAKDTVLWVWPPRRAACDYWAHSVSQLTLAATVTSGRPTCVMVGCSSSSEGSGFDSRCQADLVIHYDNGVATGTGRGKSAKAPGLRKKDIRPVVLNTACDRFNQTLVIPDNGTVALSCFFGGRTQCASERPSELSRAAEDVDDEASSDIICGPEAIRDSLNLGWQLSQGLVQWYAEGRMPDVASHRRLDAPLLAATPESTVSSSEAPIPVDFDTWHELERDGALLGMPRGESSGEMGEEWKEGVEEEVRRMLGVTSGKNGPLTVIVAQGSVCEKGLDFESLTPVDDDGGGVELRQKGTVVMNGASVRGTSQWKAEDLFAAENGDSFCVLVHCRVANVQQWLGDDAVPRCHVKVSLDYEPYQPTFQGEILVGLTTAMCIVLCLIIASGVIYCRWHEISHSHEKPASFADGCHLFWCESAHGHNHEDGAPHHHPAAHDEGFGASASDHHAH